MVSFSFVKGIVSVAIVWRGLCQFTKIVYMLPIVGSLSWGVKTSGSFSAIFFLANECLQTFSWGRIIKVEYEPRCGGSLKNDR